MKKIILALVCLPLLGSAVYSFLRGDSGKPADDYDYIGYIDEIEDAPAYDGSETYDEENYAPVPEESEDSPKPAGPVIASRPPLENADIFEIREKFFIQQCNDIYLNPDKYMGRTVKLEGMYDEFKNEEKGRTERYVIRFGPGCCGNDGVAGFEFFYDGQVAPKQDDWIEVTGIVGMINGDDGEEYIVLDKSSLRVMAKRGRETVEN
jgi:uncharacterized membrane protein YcgQ (UPF0703/DUF1980 family)